MPTFEQQQVVQLERRLAALASEFRACEDDKDRQKVAGRYAAVYRQLEQAESWVGEPYLDSQLPDKWMPKPSRKGLSAAQTSSDARREASDDKPAVSPLNAMKNLQQIDGFPESDLLADAKSFATKAGGIAQAHILLDSLSQNPSTTALR